MIFIVSDHKKKELIFSPFFKKYFIDPANFYIKQQSPDY